MPGSRKCSRIRAAVTTSNSSSATTRSGFIFRAMKETRSIIKGGPGIVWHGNQIVETLARPVFLEHLFLGDQDHVAPEVLALADEVAAFEIGGEADDIEFRGGDRACHRFAIILRWKPSVPRSFVTS